MHGVSLSVEAPWVHYSGRVVAMVRALASAPSLVEKDDAQRKQLLPTGQQQHSGPASSEQDVEQGDQCCAHRAAHARIKSQHTSTFGGGPGGSRRAV